jgi:hypothetical protein
VQWTATPLPSHCGGRSPHDFAGSGGALAVSTQNPARAVNTDGAGSRRWPARPPRQRSDAPSLICHTPTRCACRQSFRRSCQRDSPIAEAFPNVRANGVRSLDASCWTCHHWAIGGAGAVIRLTHGSMLGADARRKLRQGHIASLGSVRPADRLAFWTQVIPARRFSGHGAGPLARVGCAARQAAPASCRGYQRRRDK